MYVYIYIYNTSDHVHADAHDNKMMMHRMLTMHEFIYLLTSYSMKYNAMINNDLMHTDVRVIHLDIVSFTHTTYIFQII